MSRTGTAKKGRIRSSVIKIYAPAIALTLIGFVVAYQFVEPAPPRTLRIATGAETGAYHRVAMEYRDILARSGINLELVPTSGTVENLRLLVARAPDSPQVAFAQSGVSLEVAAGEKTAVKAGTLGPRDEEEQKTKAEQRGLISLASVFYEPLWLFHREGLELHAPADLRGKRIAIGPEGSGTRMLALQLLADNGIPVDTALDLGGEDILDAFRDSRLDAAFVVAGSQSALVQKLLQFRGLRLISFERADAYILRHRFLSRLTLPQGAIDIIENVPERDTVLLAPAATLVARDDLHPALVDLLLQAAAKVHKRGGTFERSGEFPSPDYLSFPLSADAQRYFESGPPFLQNLLPFWAATLVDRLKVLLLPFFLLLLPLLKLVPAIYSWRIGARIYRWYRDLEEIDERVRAGAPAAEIIADLDRLEEQVREVDVPLSRAHALYDLRLHLAHLRNALARTTTQA